MSPVGDSDAALDLSVKRPRLNLAANNNIDCAAKRPVYNGCAAAANLSPPVSGQDQNDVRWTAASAACSASSSSTTSGSGQTPLRQRGGTAAQVEKPVEKSARQGGGVKADSLGHLFNLVKQVGTETKTSATASNPQSSSSASHSRGSAASPTTAVSALGRLAALNVPQQQHQSGAMRSPGSGAGGSGAPGRSSVAGHHVDGDGHHVGQMSSGEGGAGQQGMVSNGTAVAPPGGLSMHDLWWKYLKKEESAEMKRMNEAKQIFTCLQCRSSFQTMDQLVKHMELTQHFANVPKHYSWSLQYARQKMRQMRMKLKYSERMMYFCHLCMGPFSTAVHQHFSDVHNMHNPVENMNFVQVITADSASTSAAGRSSSGGSGKQPPSHPPPKPSSRCSTASGSGAAQPKCSPTGRLQQATDVRPARSPGAAAACDVKPVVQWSPLRPSKPAESASATPWPDAEHKGSPQPVLPAGPLLAVLLAQQAALAGAGQANSQANPGAALLEHVRKLVQSAAAAAAANASAAGGSGATGTDPTGDASVRSDDPSPRSDEGQSGGQPDKPDATKQSLPAAAN